VCTITGLHASHCHDSAMDNGRGKEILENWSGRTRVWPVPNGVGFWIRLRPGYRSPMPVLSAPGADLFTTQPDGLWAYLNVARGFADVVCIEVCGTPQNLNDKRSRYIPASHSIELRLPRSWLRQCVPVQNNEKGWPAWKACGTMDALPDANLRLLVRFLRVLYVVTPDHFAKWRTNHVPTGYEFYCDDDAFVNLWTNPKGRAFLKRLAWDVHFR